jgi:hypothetical protein
MIAKAYATAAKATPPNLQGISKVDFRSSEAV